MRLTFTLNGERTVVDDVWEGESLLHVLRERVGASGSKNACEQGECGSCSVWLDGVLACSCLVLAGQADGCDVATVEGLADGDTLHPVQQAFAEAGAVQCGFCTPGLVVATRDLLDRVPDPSQLEVREALAGNLCRCTGYEKILDAVQVAAARMRGEQPERQPGGTRPDAWPGDPRASSGNGAPVGGTSRDDPAPPTLDGPVA